MKTPRLAAAILSSILLLSPALAADNPLPGELGGLMEQVQASHQPVVLVVGDKALKAFSDALVEITSSEGAALPDNTVFVLTPDALAQQGAGEHEHADDPWPLIAFDKDGMKTGSGIFHRGIIEQALKKLQGLPN